MRGQPPPSVACQRLRLASGLEGDVGGSVDRLDPDERKDDQGVADGAGARVEHVPVEAGEVGELARLDRAGLGVSVVDGLRTFAELCGPS